MSTDAYPRLRFDSNACQIDIGSDFGIIETHQHLSEPGLTDRTFGWGDNDIDIIMRTMNSCGIEASILQPLGGARDPKRVHRLIGDYSQAYPGRIFGIASCNIKEFGRHAMMDEYEYCVKELGFVGIKFHGFSHGINPMSDQAQAYFDSARRLGVPLMVCVGAHGQPFTNPGLFIEKAIQYPDLDIIFAHMDYTVAETAIANAARLDNLYLSSSLSITPYLEQAVSKLGPEKVLLASEDAASIPGELAKMTFATKDDDELRRVLRDAPINAFNLDGRLASQIAQPANA